MVQAYAEQSPSSKINYIIIVGDKEMESKTVSIRTRDNKVHNNIALDNFLTSIDKENKEKDLLSPFTVE